MRPATVQRPAVGFFFAAVVFPPKRPRFFFVVVVVVVVVNSQLPMRPSTTLTRSTHQAAVASQRFRLNNGPAGTMNKFLDKKRETKKIAPSLLSGLADLEIGI